MKKIFNPLLFLLILCSCSTSREGFIHKSEQPYYLDCKIQDEYDIENILIKIYLGLWHSNSTFEAYSKDMKVYLFINESTENGYDITYETTSILLKEFDYDSVASSNYVFTKNKKGQNYYISYNSYENVEIPSNIFNEDKGYFSLAFSFMTLVDNEFKYSGGTGLKLEYQKKDNFKIKLMTINTK